MQIFFVDCCGLFSDTFNAALEVDYFEFVVALLSLSICFSLFRLGEKLSRRL